MEKVDDIIKKIKQKGSFSEVRIEEFAPNKKWATIIADQTKRKMKINQLRKIFTEVKKLEMQTKGKKESDPFDFTEIYLLLPQMAYAKARELIAPEFYNLMKVVIGDDKTTKIKTVRDFQRFVQFMTAVLAYSK